MFIHPSWLVTLCQSVHTRNPPKPKWCRCSWLYYIMKRKKNFFHKSFHLSISYSRLQACWLYLEFNRIFQTAGKQRCVNWKPTDCIKKILIFHMREKNRKQFKSNITDIDTWQKLLQRNRGFTWSTVSKLNILWKKKVPKWR